MSPLENMLNTKRGQWRPEITFEELTHFKVDAKDKYEIDTFMWFILKN